MVKVAAYDFANLHLLRHYFLEKIQKKRKLNLATTILKLKKTIHFR